MLTKKSKLSKSQFAEKLGISRQAYNNYIKEEKSQIPEYTILYIMVKRLNLTMEEILFKDLTKEKK